MGHHAPTPAPITVEREEREPDDSFHEWGVPGELPGNLVEQEERKNASMAAGSDGEVKESDSEDESDEDEELLGTSFSQSPAKRDQLPQPSSPSKSSSTPPRPIPNLPMRSYSRGSDSPILSWLKRTDSTFATTFSKASASEPFDMNNLDQLSSSLLVSSGERQARRKRFHRLDSVSPSTSPSKSTSLKQKGKQREKQRMIIKQSELDEYFPIRSTSSAIPSVAHVPTSTKLQFDKEPVRGKSKAQAEVPSLRRGMMNSRLRSSEFFTPSYPK